MARGRRRRGARRTDAGRVPRGLIIGVVVFVLLAAAVVGAKLYADGVAEDDVGGRADEIGELLADATPEDFLAFNSGRSVPGSVAREVAEQDDFVNVDARADRAVIRFQPRGWWAGFTERCIVAVVEADGVRVLELKTACVRVDTDGF